MQCLTLEGMRAMMRSGKMMFDAPSPSQSPLINWAIEQNHHRWLFDQMQWIDAGGTESGRDIRNGLVACGYEPAVKQCCEQIIQADFEAHAHNDIITSALQLHPKPLPELVLQVLVHAIKYPCHPSHYKHRCLALNLIWEAAMTGHPMTQELKALIRETAHSDQDGDVKAEARRLLETYLLVKVNAGTDGKGSHTALVGTRCDGSDDSEGEGGGTGSDPLRGVR